MLQSMVDGKGSGGRNVDRWMGESQSQEERKRVFILELCLR